LNSRNVRAHLTLSIIGGSFIIILNLLGQDNFSEMDLTDRLMLGGMFITSCALGISLAVWPNWRKRKISTSGSGGTSGRKFRGHHPDCQRFKNHTIYIKNKYYCAGCLGLSLGAAMTVCIMLLYIFISINFDSQIAWTLLFVGFGFVIINLLESGNKNLKPGRHVISNVLLVSGFFLAITMTFHITANLTYAFFALLVSFLWLDTRIRLSKKRHRLICRKCRRSCKCF